MTVLSNVRIGSQTPIVAASVISPFHLDGVMLELGAVDTGFATTTWTANLVIFVPVIIRTATTIAQFYWENGATVNGNSAAALYNYAANVKLADTGPVANSGASVLQPVDITDVAIPTGKYWLAFGCDSGTTTFNRANPNLVLLDAFGIKQQASGFSSGLPVPATLATPTVGILPVFGFTTRSVV